MSRPTARDDGPRPLDRDLPSRAREPRRGLESSGFHAIWARLQCSMVTDADLAIQACLDEVIGRAFPDDGVPSFVQGWLGRYRLRRVGSTALHLCYVASGALAFGRHRWRSRRAPS